jgi:hypothetical protein
MTTYAIFRHGSNAANQSMTQRMLVDVREATSAERAKQDCGVNCYNNQFLSAKPVSKLTASEREELKDFSIYGAE